MVASIKISLQENLHIETELYEMLEIGLKILRRMVSSHVKHVQLVFKWAKICKLLR